MRERISQNVSGPMLDSGDSVINVQDKCDQTKVTWPHGTQHLAAKCQVGESIEEGMSLGAKGGPSQPAVWGEVAVVGEGPLEKDNTERRTLD